MPVAPKIRLYAAAAGRGGREGHRDAAIATRRDARAAGVGLREVAGIGPRHGDAGDCQGGRPGIVERHRLGGTGGAHVLAGIGQAARAQRHDRHPGAGAGKGHGVGRSRRVIGDGHRRATAAGRGGRERHRDAAIATRRDARAAGVGLREIAGIGPRHGDAGDCQGGRPGVVERHRLGGTAGAHVLVGIRQAAGTQRHDRHPGTGAGEGHGGGDPAALSVMVTDAPRLPAAVGVNVTEMLQFPPAATLAPQVLVCAKSPGLVPATAMLVIVKAAVPVLLSVTDWAALVVPTFWLA